MPDHNPVCHEYRHRGRSSESLNEWENEGGSLCWPSPAQQSGSSRCVVLDEPQLALIDFLPLGILITNLEGRITYSNLACQTLCGVSASQLLDTDWLEAVDARDRDLLPAAWQGSSAEGHTLTFELRMITSSGQALWTRHSIASLGPRRAPCGRIHTIEDISTIKTSGAAEQAAREELSRERERARVTLESIGDAVISTDANGCVVYLNAVAEDLTGWSREEANGQAFSRVFRVVDSDGGTLARNPAEQAMESREIVQMAANCILLRPDGSELAIEDSAAPILDADGRLAGAVVIFRDRKLSREVTSRMAYLARHDALTGLPNRVAFVEHFDQAIKLAQRHGNRVGLLFIDLRNFKQVNDSLGHEAGDLLLVCLARKLKSCVRSTDLVCRHGGDEFVVLLSEINHPEDAVRVAAKMRKAALNTAEILGRRVGLELSIGISLFPDDGVDLESLMHKADVAMYQVKSGSGTGCGLYQPSVQGSEARITPSVGLQCASAYRQLEHAGSMIDNDDESSRDPSGAS